MEKIEKVIDVEKVLLEMAPKSKYIPRFLLKPIKKFLLEEELNKLISATRHLEGLKWPRGVLDYFNIKLKTTNEQNISQSGRYIFVPNHNLGGLDGLAVFTIIGKYHKAARSLSDNYLLSIPNTRSLIVPVDPKTKSTKEFLEQVDNLYASDEQVLVFPAGLVAQKIKGEVIDLPWTKSFVTKAIQHKRWIVPVYMHTKNPPAYYRYFGFRKFIGKLIHMTIEPYFLLRQSFKHYNNTITMNFGKPFSWEVFDKSKTHEEWAQKVREHVFSLGKENDFEFLSKEKE